MKFHWNICKTVFYGIWRIVNSFDTLNRSDIAKYISVVELHTKWQCVHEIGVFFNFSSWCLIKQRIRLTLGWIRREFKKRCDWDWFDKFQHSPNSGHCNDSVHHEDYIQSIVANCKSENPKVYLILCSFPEVHFGWRKELITVKNLLSFCRQYPCSFELGLWENCRLFTHFGREHICHWSSIMPFEFFARIVY